MKSTPHPPYFSRFELALWLGSAAAILLSFFLSESREYFSLFVSLLGATSLILLSKGNVWGQGMMVVFCICYGIISYSYRYYGEMITYLGMTMPIAAASIVTWLRHPAIGKRREVQVYRPRCREYLLILLLGTVVSVAFWFLLRALQTANLFLSTVSVFTSFVAVVLSMRRSALYALAYAANDAVLILLWCFASLEDPAYVGMTVCFLAFLVNDLYGYVNWKRMEREQRADPGES